MTYPPWDVEAEFLSWSSVSCQVARLPGCQVHCAAREQGLLGNRLSFSGISGRQWVIPSTFSPIFAAFWVLRGQPRVVDSLLESLAHTFAELWTGVVHNSPPVQTPTAEIRTALHLITRRATLLYSAPQSYTILQNTSGHHRTTSFPSPYNLSPHNSAPCSHCWKAKHSISR